MGKITQDKTTDSAFAKLLEKQEIVMPNLGDVIKGTVISSSKSEVTLDLNGVTTGIVRGRGLFNESDEYANLKPGDEIEATVIELENEHGEIELSFRYAGQQKAWETLRESKESGDVKKVKILDANKGGLMIKLGSIRGFLPVSQLTPEHYPRVEGGDKNKILETLKGYIGSEFDVKVMDADEKDEKLIVSEKMAWADNQKEVMAKYAVGQKIKGKVTAVTGFGVFVEFDDKMEGLVHISEIAWQRIDDPRELVKVNDVVEAEIINIDGTKIFLSMKKLIADPWANVSEKYTVGDLVKGTVLKVNPFGLFVELDSEIHGLAHISELSSSPISNVDEIAKTGDVMEFKIVSVEPDAHRLGLSLKALTDNATSEASDTKKVKEKVAEETPEEKTNNNDIKDIEGDSSPETKKDEDLPQVEAPAKKDEKEKITA